MSGQLIVIPKETWQLGFGMGTKVDIYGTYNKISLSSIYENFPKKTECLKIIKEARWKGRQACPKCSSTSFTSRRKMEYQCRECLGIYSPTCKTLMKSYKIDLQKWFYVICAIENWEISGRKLAEIINVDKDTVYSMVNKIYNPENEEFVRNIKETIVKVNSLYIIEKYWESMVATIPFSSWTEINFWQQNPKTFIASKIVVSPGFFNLGFNTGINAEWEKWASLQQNLFA